MSDKPRFVVDTNVLIDAACFARSFGRRAFDHARDHCLLVGSIETMHELVEVLRRPRLARYIQEEGIEKFLTLLCGTLTIVAPTERIRACRDPKDDKFLEVAVAASAATILSRDADLLVLHPFRGIEILEPEAYVTRVAMP